MFSSHLCLGNSFSSLQGALSKAFNYKVSFLVLWFRAYWRYLLLATVWFINSREVECPHQSCLLSFWPWVVLQRPRSLSCLCLQQQVARWAGQVSRWGAACQTALAAGLVGLPESAEPGFLPVCSESRAPRRPRWQLSEKSPDAVSHPEVAGHSSSCPAPKCSCSAPACSGGQPHGWG